MVVARLSNMISPFAVIVPIPNRCGYARETLELAKVLSKYSGVPIAEDQQKVSVYGFLLH